MQKERKSGFNNILNRYYIFEILMNYPIKKGGFL